MPVMKRGPRRRATSNTRARILESALDLFARDGYEHTTVRSIARRCTLTDAALYYYFRSKKELLDALLLECWDDQRLWRNEPTETAKAMSWDVLEAIVHWTLEGIARNAAMLRLVGRQCLFGDAVALRIRNERQDRWRGAVRSRFDERFRPDKVEPLVETLRVFMVAVGTHLQVQYRDRVAEVARDPAFRKGIYRAARTAVPLDRYIGTKAAGA